jgi:hypothetical protein
MKRSEDAVTGGGKRAGIYEDGFFSLVGDTFFLVLLQSKILAKIMRFLRIYINNRFSHLSI